MNAPSKTASYKRKNLVIPQIILWRMHDLNSGFLPGRWAHRGGASGSCDKGLMCLVCLVYLVRSLGRRYEPHEPPMLIAPILELCKVLHARGHTIEFACLADQRNIQEKYPFVSKTHIIGRAITPEEDAEVYRVWDDADLSTPQGRKDVITGFKFFSSFWPETYKRLSELMITSKPDFIIGEVLTEACADIMNEWNIPAAIYYAQLPMHMAPQKYLPGIPGMQQRCLTSEHASIWDRLYEELWAMRFFSAFHELIAYKKMLRKAAGAPPPQMIRKPKYLAFANTFFGLEPPRPLPPLVVPVGPLISMEWGSLDSDMSDFLSTKKKTIYVAFGSHVNLPDWRIARVINGLAMAIEKGYIDSVVWGLKVKRTTLNDPEASSNQPTSLKGKIDYTAVLTNQHAKWRVVSWAPQRAILAHPSCCLFFSHCAMGSTNEALVHGVPILGMPFYVGDQMGNARRIEAAGSGLFVDKHRFSAAEVRNKIGTITLDVEGSFARNVLRMQRLAISGTKRKFVFADMIEEVLADHELRHDSADRDRKELRPMYLQTPDARMPWYKANNFDLYLTCAGFLSLALVPLYFASRLSLPPVGSFQSLLDSVSFKGLF